MKTTRLVVALIAAVAMRGAEPLQIPAAGGRYTLPLSGLSVTFPAQPEGQRELKGSWSLKTSYDARDVIDEFKDGKLVAGTWVQTGYFDAGGPRATVESSELTDAWPTTTMEAWGLTWQVRGGKYQFTGSLGLQPAIVFATDRATEQPTLLIAHYFIGAGSLSGDEMIGRVKESALVGAVVKAYRQQHWGSSLPTRNPAVTPRDNSVAARTVTLVKHGLTLQLPDDGFVWKPEDKPKGITDFLYRLGPTFPELTLDILLVDATSIDDGWKSIGLSRPTGLMIANLPDGWEVGPEVSPSNGKESTVAKLIGAKVLIVGFIGNTTTVDVAPYAPVLEAIAAAVAGKDRTRREK